jgi:dTDP-4-dehydrorhamnose reductase
MNNNEDIEVTDNEYSVPTSTDMVFKYIYGVLNGKLSGIIHAVCNIDDMVSRYDFAKCIAEHYNSLVDTFPDINKQKIDINKIKPVTRNDKLQPTHSHMYPTPLSIVDSVFSCNSIILNWKNELYWFLRNNFNKLI